MRREDWRKKQVWKGECQGNNIGWGSCKCRGTQGELLVVSCIQKTCAPNRKGTRNANSKRKCWKGKVCKVGRWKRNSPDFGNTALSNVKIQKHKFLWGLWWFTWSQDADEISALDYFFAVERILTEPEGSWNTLLWNAASPSVWYIQRLWRIFTMN